MNCSAEMFDAISEAPMAHQVSEPSARKKSVVEASGRFFLLVNPVAVGGDDDEIDQEDRVVDRVELVHRAAVWREAVAAEKRCRRASSEACKNRHDKRLACADC